jgi:hypothetical protein
MKTYKILLMLIALISFSSRLLSQQWSVQHSGLPDSPDPTLIFSAVDSNVCWGIQNQSALPSDILNPKLVLTTDGGNHWSLMEIQGIKGMEALSIFSIDSLIAYITLDNPDSAGDGGIYKTITVD